MAEAAYEKAYKLWQDQQYERAVKDMVLLASNYTTPDMVPKALLATGSIYLEWAARDRLDVHALPLPDVPDSLLFSYGLVDSTIFSFPTSATAPSLASPVVPDTIAAAQTDEVEEGGLDLENPAIRRAVATLVRADSLRGISDRLYTLSDSLYVVSDSYYGQTDELQAISDSLYKVSENLQLRSDSLFARADSLENAAALLLRQTGRGDMSPDSLRRLIGTTPRQTQARNASRARDAGPRILKLDRLFAAVKERFPQSAHAQFADQMLRAIVELRPGQDTTIVQALAQEDLQKEIEKMPPEELHMKGPGTLDVNGEGWTLIVGSFSEPDRAGVIMQEYRSKGYKSGVIQGATRFRVAVGQFPTLEDARAGLEVYKEELPPTTWFLDIQKPR
jgi:hypothetical protein